MNNTKIIQKIMRTTSQNSNEISPARCHHRCTHNEDTHNENLTICTTMTPQKPTLLATSNRYAQVYCESLHSTHKKILKPLAEILPVMKDSDFVRSLIAVITWYSTLDSHNSCIRATPPVVACNVRLSHKTNLH